MNTQALPVSLLQRARAFYALTKPRVVSLIVFTAVIGMFLATPGMVPPRVLLAGTFGIALVAGAAAAINCLVEQNVDALLSMLSRLSSPRAARKFIDERGFIYFWPIKGIEFPSLWTAVAGNRVVANKQ